MVKPQLTDMGKTLLLRAAGGEEFTLTKFQCGNGILEEGETPKSMTALKSVTVDDIGITQSESTEDEGYIKVTGTFNNLTDVASDFVWTELGLIAEDGEGNEYLFAYAYDAENAETIYAGGGAVVTEQTISMIVAVGDTENITVNIIPDATYASKQSFDAHLADQTNPHHVTLAQVGAAAEEHTHSANDISTGTLPEERGGTGVGSLSELAQAMSGLLRLSYVIGGITGNGAYRQNVNLGFTPSAVILFAPLQTGSSTSLITNSSIISQVQNNQYYRNSASKPMPGYYFSPGNNLYHDECGAQYATCDADTLFSRNHGGAAVMTNGFAIGYGNTGGRQDLNANGSMYLYIAFR